MIKKFYVLVWLMLIGGAFAAVLDGTFDATSTVALSIGALGLLYVFALWAVFRDPESAHQADS